MQEARKVLACGGARPNEPSEELGFSSVLELLERHIGVKECFELPLELNL